MTISFVFDGGGGMFSLKHFLFLKVFTVCYLFFTALALNF